MALQHLRSSTANKRPLPAGMSDGQLAVNTNLGSPGLFFKDSNGDLVKVGPVHVGATAPNASPAAGGATGNTKGEQWLDTSGTNPVLKVWDGSAWQSEAGEFVNASGDTMTGALVMDNQQQVRFRETTANGTNYVAIQAPASVGADRTLTLPDVSGTIVSTGDTGTVTSTMIADGTIVNADINASAAIAGTKISPDFGSQNVTTTGVVSAAAGAAATPSIAFTGDENTGIYSPGADQVAISTGGSGRLFVDASGNVGAGTSSPASRLHVDDGIITTGRYGNLGALILRRAGGTAASPAQVTSAGTVAGIYARGLNEAGAYNGVSSIGFGNDGAISSTSSPGYFVVETTPSSSTSPQERLRITSAGLVGVGTSTPGRALDIVGSPIARPIANTNNAADWFFAGGITATSDPRVAMGIFVEDSVNNKYALTFATQTNFSAGITEKMRITSGGNVGIGTTSPGARLQVAGDAIIQDNLTIASTSSEGGQITINDPSNAASLYIDVFDTLSPRIFSVTNNVQFQYGQLAGTGGILRFFTAGLERFRCDSSGRLLVGTSTGRSVAGDGGSPIQISGTGYGGLSIVSNTNDVAAPVIAFAKNRSGSVGGSALVQNGDTLGVVHFAGADGTDLETVAANIFAQVDGTPGANDMPGRLVFSTTADGASSPTERMRISNNGTTSIGYTANTDYRLGVRGGSAENVVIGSDSTRAQGSGWYNFYGTSDSAAVLQSFIRGDGAYGSRTSTYGGLSDAKLKENIVDAQSQWGDIKSVRFRNFNLIGDSTRQLGVIAQEIEQISPGLVDEINDRDEQGNETGTSTKLVKYSILYMKAVKALQEAMERIETLEAKVAALESA